MIIIQSFIDRKILARIVMIVFIVSVIVISSTVNNFQFKDPLILLQVSPTV